MNRLDVRKILAAGLIAVAGADPDEILAGFEQGRENARDHGTRMPPLRNNS